MSRKVLFKRLSLLLVLLIGILVLQCSKNPTANKQDAPEEPIPDLPSVEKRLIESDNKFGLKLFRELNKEEESDSNIFISPLSVAMALGMTYNGAAGETQKAMRKTLELEGFTLQEVNQCYRHLMESLTQLDPKVEFALANSIWYRLGLTPREEFVNLCQKYFDALVRGLKFSNPDAADTINGWVEENTNGKIKNLVEKPISGDIVMFLINTIYFNGAWTYQFDKDETKQAWFYLPDNSRKHCMMMEQRGLFDYYQNEIFQAIDLPYGDKELSMTIFLPWPRIDIDSLIGEFTPENLSHWIGLFEEDSVDVYLPRFKLEYRKTLNQVLITLGMGIAFGAADFSKMFESLNVFISRVEHKSFIEVNEEGTEAAAATVVVMSYGGGPSGLIIEINRPFLFMIRENVSGTILFIGKIVDPGFDES
jgi:serine protease inhibitor